MEILKTSLQIDVCLQTLGTKFTISRQIIELSNLSKNELN